MIELISPSALLFALVAFAVGARVGIWSEARQWRNNAGTYLRRESGGSLYKVEKVSP